MQTLRKKTSPLKYKNETSRFLGEGVSFKAKLIGILEVSEARGDRMCQEALSDLKTAIRAAGEHKQRITINIAIDGLRLRDEKTGDSLYHHPVHKISFIAQDMTDSRAFGYIFGSPDTGHRFFGIKTDKAASQVVIAMRDLFQVVFALKKKEIELAKQHLDKNRYGTSPPLFSESSISSSKLTNMQESSKNINAENKASVTTTEKSTPAVADLVDLELELNSLQQGLNQMERITPSDPFGSKDDPFGDSFTPFPKPILPPPPSSGKERTSRSSESSSLFSPKTPHTATGVDVPTTDSSLVMTSKDMNLSNELNMSHDDTSSGDWFKPSSNNALIEEATHLTEAPKDEHEIKKQEILSQFDVFTELDPLGTGKIKPYIDKKHFFQELKNPPKKVLNDLVSENQPQETTTVVFFPTNFETKQNNISPHLFPSDPFGEDPFVKTDPFAEADFPKQDPFETEFEVFNREGKNDQSESVFKSELQNLFVSKSPKSSFLDKQMSLVGKSPRSSVFMKQNTFDVQFDKFGKMSQLHENPSLDLSSESECAPEPPPRPTSNLVQVKPPPLPPKKQLGEMCIKAPPRPPHSDDTHYDYMDTYETAPNSLEYIKNLEKSPALPVPLRKSKFESDFILPERTKKQYNLSEDEDYLTPVSLSKTVIKTPSPILLPPPQRSTKKSTSPNLAQVTVASYLESKPHLTTSISKEKNSLDGLDITLSQLTVSGLNELAAKLNIPTAQLSNMTLVQLTSYLSNFIKNKNENENNVEKFADFANFNNMQSETYDRYAVFRELLQEEIKQTKIDAEPQEIFEEKPKIEQEVDKYAALREIVDIEVKHNGKDTLEENDINEDERSPHLNEDNEQSDTQLENEANIINTEKFVANENVVIEYSTTVEKNIDAKTPIKSPVKSPVNKLVKSPVPIAVTEIIQNNTRLTSGSLSDVVSGSSPEIDNTGSTSEVVKKDDAAGESWAIFDQPNLIEDISKEKQTVQSEEGVSPWSSDSKEFGNGSPPEYRPRIDSESGGEHWGRRRNHEGWWDTSAEPVVQYCPPNRRSTDSYEDECYDYYDKPRRRRQAGWHSHSGHAAGGHSSSSRDVSPWEEEPNRKRDVREGTRDFREGRDSRQWSSRHGYYFGRHMDRTHTDSWDEEDDYEYEEEHSNRFHWQDRHISRDSDRRGGINRDHESDRWIDERSDERRQLRRRREIDTERWCCPDWDPGEIGRYPNTRRCDVPMPTKWRDRKNEERCYSRESQESPWEDDYSNDPEETHTPHYLTIKRNWKRPSSATEVDRKAMDIKSRHGPFHLGTGGSDGERDRRYKPTRRSKSRESQFSDTSHNRHKPDSGLTLRSRSKHHHQKTHFENEFQDVKKAEGAKLEQCNKKNSNIIIRKKPKDQSTKSEDIATFSRKGTTRAQSLFENDFVSTENDSPLSGVNQRFCFENDFETSETESPTIASKNIGKIYEKPKTNLHKFEPEFNKESRDKKSLRYQTKHRSLFEDDFSPTEKLEVQENVGISSIKEEASLNDEEEEYSMTNFRSSGRKRILSKNRYSNNTDLKKSESINIFARENDPFDDDFFSGKDTGGETPCGNNEKTSPKTTELKWTEQFEHFDNNEGK